MEDDTLQLGKGATAVAVRAEPEKRKRRLRPWRILGRIAKWTTLVSAGFVLLSVGLVLLYGWLGPPPTITMMQRGASGMDVRREWVKLKDISPHLVRAVLAAEDQRFCTHNGFDLTEIRKAIDEAERGERLRGASTISQQTAKNVFLWNGGGFVRKGFEAWFTLLVEQTWSKPRILEVYLNVAEWGDGLFGAEAAAQARFGVSAKTLTRKQAALLAAVLPSPNRWKVTSRRMNSRSNTILSLASMVRRDDLDTCVIK